MLLVIVAVVPLLVFLLGYQYVEYRGEVAATGEQTLALARSMSLLVEETLQARIDALQVLSTSRLLRAGDIEAFRQQAEEVLNRQFPGTNIVLLREDGQQVMNTLVPRGAALPIRPNTESVRRVFKTGLPAVSDLYQRAIGPRPVIAVDVPVKAADGTVQYALSIVQTLNQGSNVFSDVIANQHLPKTWVASVFDGHGVNIARVPNAERFVGRLASPSLIGFLQGGTEGTVENNSLEGTPLLSVWSHGEKFGWAIAIGVPRTELLGPVVSRAIRTSLAGATLLVAGLALAVYAARRIARPIDSLRQLAASAGQDSLPDPAQTGLPEVDEVAAALYSAEAERRRSRQAEVVLRDGIDSIPEGFAIYDEQDRLVMCNESYRSLFPDSPERIVVGARYEDIIRAGVEGGHYAADGVLDEEWIAARVREHRQTDTPIEQRLADGRWVIVTKHRLSNGWIAGLRVDITALRTTQEALRSSERAERALRDGIETMPQGFVIYDDQDRLVICNEAYRQFYPETAHTLVPGVSFEEILRIGIAHGRFPDVAGREEEWIAERMRRQHDEVGTIEQRVADGRWVLVTKHRLANGWVAGLRVDSTAIKAAEEALRNSERELKRAQQLAQLGSFIWDSRTDKVEWSDETYRIFGVERGSFELTRESILRFVHPDDYAAVLAATEAVTQGTVPTAFEYRIVRPDGGVRTAYRDSEIVSDEHDNPRYLAGTFQDVTERRRTEDQLRQAQKMEAIGNLTGGMAHDFNNLLGVIVGNLELARENIGDENDDLGELVGEALEAAWRGADLTRRLLAFARRQPLHPARVELNDLINDTVRLLGRLLGEDIQVSLNLGQDVWPVMVDPAQLEASLANLATNARDAMPRGGRLIITTANRSLDADYAAAHSDVTPGDFVMIEVSDTGAGMSAATITQIFEPFFTTKEAGKGTGLGLSMVFGFLKQSGGHVNVYSEPGAGTTFRLYLPRATTAETTAEADVVAAAPQGAGETVLVVEDNPGMRRISTRQLRDLGYQVLECDQAAAALDILQRERVDLLFTDIVMSGGLDGVELAQLAQERWPTLKIVLTSGFPQARVDGNGELGSLRLLSKPYRKEELAAVLRAALGG
jgi:PAS domain S-box-containing protein